MAELVGSRVSLIFAPGPESRATRREGCNLHDSNRCGGLSTMTPLTRGLVKSLARPAGTLRGVFVRQLELTSKRLELLREAVPSLRDVAVFWDSFSAEQLAEAMATGKASRLNMRGYEFGDPPYRFEETARSLASVGGGALLTLASPVFFRQRSDLRSVSPAKSSSFNCTVSRVGGSGIVDVVWCEPAEHAPARRRVRRQDTEGRKSSGFAHGAVNRV